jgi:hypothetical protein
LQALIEAVPYTIHTVLTDNGIQFDDMLSQRTGPTARYRLHMFDRICREQGIEHRLTKPNHPWTNDQVERMNLRKPPFGAIHYGTHRQLQEHLEAFLTAYNFAKRLKTLRGLTPLRAHLQSLDRPARPPHRPLPPSADRVRKGSPLVKPRNFCLVSVRERIESSESFVIQEWWPDSRRVTDVDGEEPRSVRPQRIAISEQSDRL